MGEFGMLTARVSRGWERDTITSVVSGDKSGKVFNTRLRSSGQHGAMEGLGRGQRKGWSAQSHGSSNALASLCPTVKHPPAEPSRFISVPTKTADKMGFDEVGQAFWNGGRGTRGGGLRTGETDGGSMPQVFMINLQRRQDRRERMLQALQAQEIECRLVEAVDGK